MFPETQGSEISKANTGRVHNFARNRHTENCYNNSVL